MNSKAEIEPQMNRIHADEEEVVEGGSENYLLDS
jgi:hypothetical protein